MVKRGFRGEIIATGATRELGKLILLDSAHLHEEEANRRRRWAQRGGVEAQVPLYEVPDALWAMDFFGRVADYDEPVALNEHVTVRFIDAGHILGSASLVVDVEEERRRRRFVFSGDLGNRGRPIVRDPTSPPRADYVVMETTYGDRCHRGVEASVEEFEHAILEALDRGGNVIIPTFALERAQELLYHLREGISKGRLPRHLPVFLDSPMAISATEIFRRHPECFDREAREAIVNGVDPFSLPRFRFTREAAESMALNDIGSGAVIMAGSGMCTGGGVRHHLKHNLWREQCSIVFVGFAARGTLAREIIDGAREVHLFGESVRVKARIHTINGFSAHADRDELLAWHRRTGEPRTTFLVHGDPDRGMAQMAGLLEARARKVARPELHQRFELE